MRHQLSRISAVLRPAVVELRHVHPRLHRFGAPAHSQAPTTPSATAVACGDRVPAAPVRSRHSLPRFLVREDAYVRASGPAPLRGGVLTRRPIVLRTAPLSATGRFLFRIGAGALRQCSAGASGAPVLWSTPPAMPLSEDMRSAFRFSNACSLAKRCSLVSCWLFMSRSCMYIRVEWAEHHIISYHAPHERTGPSNKTSHPTAHALTRSISFRRRMRGKTGAGEFHLRHSASHLILITTRSLCKDGLCSKLINTH